MKCAFNIKASGQSRENLQKFVEVLTNNKDYNKPYIYGIEDISAIDFGDKVVPQKARVRCDNVLISAISNFISKIFKPKLSKKDIYTLVDAKYCIIQKTDGSYMTVWRGICKWSLSDCMRDKVNIKTERIQLSDEKNQYTLERLSKDLDLVIEYFSQDIDYDAEFGEHCIIAKGVVIEDDDMFTLELGI